MQWKRTLTVVGCHAEGEVGNVVTGGVGHIPGDTMFDKKRYLETNLDGLRKLLLFEPRGAAVHCANIVLPSNNPKAAMGYIILEAEECPPMSGSNTMCVATVLLETGMLAMQEPVTRLTLEAPGGLIDVVCQCRDGKVTQVKFTNVPSFVYHIDIPIEVEGVGTISVDVAYGGMTYALADAKGLGFEITPDEARDLCVLGEKIKAAADDQLETVHPENPEIRGITQTEFMGPLHKDGEQLTARNAVVVKPGRLDRSPCGTGTSARLAVMHAKGLISPGQIFDHVSIIGSHFFGEIEDTTTLDDKPAVITSVAGQAWISFISQHGLAPTDPFPQGYTLSDTWLRAI
ncbi:MAG: proline racemase family protein [Gammaproteobacteria bacterium]|nr:proline racemase family protein [Gammaproteobacteria bacterium]